MKKILILIMMLLLVSPVYALPPETTTTQPSSYFDFEWDIPSLMGGETDEDREATVNESIDEVEESVIVDETDGDIADTKEDLTEKIKSEEGKLNFSDWIILPILGLGLVGLVVVYYLYTLKRPIIPNWMSVNIKMGD